MILLTACDDKITKAPTLASSGSIGSAATTPTTTDTWLGKWNGPEGTFIDISGGNGNYTITIQNLDGPKQYQGVGKDNQINFERDGTTETIQASNGAETGMKWLADKSNCLRVRVGEGWCRDQGMKLTLVCGIFFLLSSCVSRLPTFTTVKDLSRGSDNADSFCKSFTLSDTEVLAFFNNAKEVSGMVIHYEYDYLPCYVKGKITTTQSGAHTEKACAFTIRAGGTAELACVDEPVKFYACNACDNLLPGKP